MATSDPDTQAAHGGPAAQASTEHDSVTAHYAPGSERPLGSYALITSAYVTLFGGTLLALRRRGHELPERPAIGDLLLIGVASHKLSRLLAKDKVTSFARAPFTQFQEASGQGEVEERPYGHGLRYAIGELLVCPYCLAQWVATAMTLGLVGAPRFTRFAGSVLASHSISDFLQAAYRAAEEHS
jgi:hypothetical protein